MQLLITGANRGIGLALAREALAAGHHVIATARDPAGARALSALAGERLEVQPLDVRRSDSVAALARAVGDRPLDALINNAGVYGDHADLEALDYEDALATYDVNALGPLRVTAALLPALRRGQHRRVAHVSSMMGSIADNGSGGSYAYRMSKAALNMAARSMAVDLAPEGFVVVAMNPGWVRTDMGGPGAPTSAEECARGILTQLLRLDRAESGAFVDYRGGPHRPW